LKLEGRKVTVVNDNVDKALRKFKKKIAESGLLNEVRDRQEYIKPTTQRKLKAGAAKSRWRKHLKTQELPKKLY
jgi:small subunit ribosomal protein S21